VRSGPAREDLFECGGLADLAGPHDDLDQIRARAEMALERSHELPFDDPCHEVILHYSLD
jgi:hypothetical protein